MSVDPLDLTTTAFVTQQLAAGKVTLTAAQVTALQDMVTAASIELQAVMGRYFPAADLDEIVTPAQGRADRGEPATARLSRYPVNSVARISGSRVTALTVVNTDRTTNQIARISLTTTGNPAIQLTYTGISCYRMASGTATTNTATFAIYPTIAALATQINTFGGGWTATVSSGFTLWPSTELVGAREPKPGFSPGAALAVYSTEVESASIDRDTGILSVGQSPTFGPLGWGGNQGFATSDDDDGQSTWGGQIRVGYNGGYATIPLPIQQITAETVQGMITRLSTDPSLKSESAKDYSWVARDVIGSFTPSIWNTLYRWKDWRV